MRKNAHLLAATVLLFLSIGGCANQARLQQQQQLAERQRQAQMAMQAVVDDCMAKKRSEPGLQAMLGSKVPLGDIREMTLAMMASTEKPTEEERKMIFRSLEITMGCQKNMLDVTRQYYAAPAVTTLEAAFNHALGLGLEAYHGRLTYGEWNRKVKELYTNYMQAMAQIEAELRNQNAEAAARAQQLANQQQQLFLNYLNTYNTYMYQQQQLLQSQTPRPGIISCRQMGAFTTCNY